MTRTINPTFAAAFLDQSQQMLESGVQGTGQAVTPMQQYGQGIQPADIQASAGTIAPPGAQTNPTWQAALASLPMAPEAVGITPARPEGQYAVEQQQMQQAQADLRRVQEEQRLQQRVQDILADPEEQRLTRQWVRGMGGNPKLPIEQLAKARAEREVYGQQGVMSEGERMARKIGSVRQLAEGLAEGSVGAAGDAVANVLGTGADLFGQDELAQEFYQVAEARQRRKQIERNLRGGKATATEVVGEFAGMLLPSAISLVATGGAAAPILFYYGVVGTGGGVEDYRVVMEELKDEAMAQGMSEAEAEEKFGGNAVHQLAVGVGFGAVEVAAEKLGLEVIGKMGTKAAGRIGQRILAGNFEQASKEIGAAVGIAGVEGIEEALTQAAQNAISTTYDPSARSVGGILEGTPSAFGLGALGGGVLSLPALATPAGRRAIVDAFEGRDNAKKLRDIIEGEVSGEGDVIRDDAGQIIDPQTGQPVERRAPLVEARPSAQDRTIEVQTRVQNVQRGEAPAAVIRPGEQIPETPEGLKSTYVEGVGLVVFDPGQVNQTQIRQAASEGTLDQLIGPQIGGDTLTGTDEGRPLSGQIIQPITGKQIRERINRDQPGTFESTGREGFGADPTQAEKLDAAMDRGDLTGLLANVYPLIDPNDTDGIDTSLIQGGETFQVGGATARFLDPSDQTVGVEITFPGSEGTFDPVLDMQTGVIEPRTERFTVPRGALVPVDRGTLRSFQGQPITNETAGMDTTNIPSGRVPSPTLLGATEPEPMVGGQFEGDVPRGPGISETGPDLRGTQLNAPLQTAPAFDPNFDPTKPVKINNELPEPPTEIPQDVEGAVTPVDTPEIVRARAEQADQPETIGINTPERVQLRKSIEDELYGQGATKKERTAYIVIGPPAAGKSSVAVEAIQTAEGALVIDADEAKERLPEFQGGRYAGAVHKESSVIAERIQARAVEAGDNIILPIVGKNSDKVQELAATLRQAGYTPHLVLVDLDPAKSALRAVSRFEETGRFVDPDYLLNEVGTKPMAAYAKAKETGSYESFTRISTDVPRGQAPIFIEQEGVPSAPLQTIADGLRSDPGGRTDQRDEARDQEDAPEAQGVAGGDQPGRPDSLQPARPPRPADAVPAEVGRDQGTVPTPGPQPAVRGPAQPGQGARAARNRAVAAIQERADADAAATGTAPPAILEVPEQELTPEEREIRDYADARGTRLVWVDAGEKLRHPALAYKGILVIDRNASPGQKKWGLVVHELIHTLQDVQPRLWSELREALVRIDPELVRKAEREYANRVMGLGRALTPQQLEEEGPSVLGEVMVEAILNADSTTLVRVANSKPGLITRIGNELARILRKLGVNVRPFGAQTEQEAKEARVVLKLREGLNALEQMAQAGVRADARATEPLAPTGTDSPAPFAAEGADIRFAAAPPEDSLQFRTWFKNSKVVDEQGRPKRVYHGTPKPGFTIFESSERSRGGLFFTDSYHLAMTYSGKRGTVELALPLESVDEIDPDLVDDGYAIPELDANKNSPTIFESIEDLQHTFGLDKNDTDGIVRAKLVMSRDGYNNGVWIEDEWDKLLEHVNYEPEQFAQLSDPDQNANAGQYEVYLSLQNPMEYDAKGNYWNDVDGTLDDDLIQAGYQGTTTNDLVALAREAGHDGLIIRDVADMGTHSRGGESGDVYVAFDSRQVKSATENTGAYDPTNPDIRFAAAPPVDSPEFRSWFEGSKITNPDGSPLVVLHGTRAEEPFNTFQRVLPTDVLELDGREVPIIDAADVSPDFTAQPDAILFGAMVDAQSFEGGAQEALEFRRRETPNPKPGGMDWRVQRDLERMIGKKISRRTERRPAGGGFWFTPNESYGFISQIGQYGAEGGGRNARVYPVVLSIKNPVILDEGAIESAGQPWRVEEFKRQGYDGAIFAGDPSNIGRAYGAATQIVAFDSTQVKSVNNAGTFDPQNPDIRFAAAPPVDSPEFRSWFEGSALTNEDGTPQRLYHATGSEFTRFEPSRFRGAIFLATTPRGAHKAAAASQREGTAANPNRTVPVYASAKHVYARSAPPWPELQEATTRGPINHMRELQDLKDQVFNRAFAGTTRIDSRTEKIARQLIASEFNRWLMVDQQGNASIAGRPSEMRGSTYQPIEPEVAAMDWETFEKGPSYSDGRGIMQSVLKALGYDGAMIGDEAIGTVAVFEPTQVKSVNNAGTFDPTNPDIRFAAAPPVNSREFRSWFGNSAVRDADGNPRVMYHGTKQRFTAFEHQGHSTDTPAFYFTPDPSYAQHYAGADYRLPDDPTDSGRTGVLMPVYLNVSNPLDATHFHNDTITGDELLHWLEGWGVQLPGFIENELDGSDYKLPFWAWVRGRRAIRNAIREAGFDAIRQIETNTVAQTPTAEAWIVFDAGNVKGIYNRGSYDPTDPDVRFAADDLADVERVQDLAGQVQQNPNQEIGRPHLAIPSTDEGARAVFRGVDQARKEAGRPERSDFGQHRQEARQRLAQDYEGEKQAMLEQIDRGIPLDETQMLMAAQIGADAGVTAITSGDPQRYYEAIRIMEAYRETRTDVARRLAIIRDPLLSPAERHKQMLGELLTSPGAKQRAAIETLRERARKAETEKEIQELRRKVEVLQRREAAQAKKMQDALRKAGIEPAAITDETMADPKTAARIGRIQAAVKADAFDMILEFWINSILSAPITQSRNITGNAIFGTWEVLGQRLVEAGINVIARDPEAPQLGELAAMTSAVIPGLKRAAQNAVTGFSTEAPVLEDEIRRAGGEADTKAGSKIDLGGKRGAIPGVAGRVIRVPGRTLLFFDEFFKGLWGELEAAAHAYRIAKAEGLEGRELGVRMTELQQDLSSEAWQAAMEEARKITFQKELGNIGQEVLRWRNRHRALTFILPFVTTPGNIFKEAVNKSPLKTLQLLYRSARVGATKLNLDDGTYEYRKSEVISDLANSIVGWGLFLVLREWALGDDEGPWITGTASPDPGERALQYRSAPPLSVKLGGEWYGYQGIEPFSTTFGSVIDSINVAERDGSLAAMVNVPRSLLRQMQDKTFLRGISDFYEAVVAESSADTREGVLTGKAARYASNFAVSWVPNILRRGIGDADPYLRDLSVRKDQDGDILAPILTRTGQRALPIPANLPPIRVDVWGRDIRKRPEGSHPATDWLYRTVVPFDRRQTDELQIDRLLVNWNNSTAAAEAGTYFPRPPSATLSTKIDGQSKAIRLTDEEYHRYAKESGQRAADRLKRLIDAGRLDVEQPTIEDIDVIRDTLRDERRRVANQIKNERRRGAGILVAPGE